MSLNKNQNNYTVRNQRTKHSVATGQVPGFLALLRNANRFFGVLNAPLVMGVVFVFIFMSFVYATSNTVRAAKIATPVPVIIANTECSLDASKFGIPTWYKYLDGQIDPASGNCQAQMDFNEDSPTEQLNIPLAIGIAILEMLIFIAGIIAVGFVMYGGFRYVTSQGEPENTRAAKDTILNAVIGVVIAIMATTIVRFVASRLTGGGGS